MRGLTAAARISLSLALLIMTLLLTAQAIGLVPDRAGAIRDGRAALAEAIAVQLTAAARDGQPALARKTAAAIVEQNADLLSIGMRDSDGRLFFCLCYLRCMLPHLDRSSAIPVRVKAALDALSEGVLILDRHERIALANDAFTRLSGRASSELAGKPVSTLPWQARGSSQNPKGPWVDALRHGNARRGERLSLLVGPDCRTLIVNATPIPGSGRQPQGALATFDDVTHVERRDAELRNMLAVLEESRDKIRRQNGQLHLLATRDPLTQCLDRRAFCEHLEKAWSNANRYQTPLALIMLDLDHLKSINDTHGHAMGNQVLQQVARTVQSNLRTGDILCRYGGEEFCALLSNTSGDGGTRVAEKLRIALAAARVAGISVTATFGVTAMNLAAANATQCPHATMMAPA